MTDQSGAAACCPPEAEGAMRGNNRVKKGGIHNPQKTSIFLLIRLPQSMFISFQGQKESQGVTGKGGLNCVCCFIFMMTTGHVGYPLAVFEGVQKNWCFLCEICFEVRFIP